MRLVTPIDVNHAQLIPGTPEEQEQARREWQQHKRTAAIVNNPKLTEIPRSELTFGRYWIEHSASADGDYYRAFGGDPEYVGDDVRAYYVNDAGTPCLLQRASNPSSRAELERIRETREQRNAANEAAAKERRARIRAGVE
jgi:hypothetical protein